MTDYEIYVFILCFIVFSMFTALFSYVITVITKMRLKIIKHGLEDDKIINELAKKKRISCFGSFVSNLITFIFCVALLVAFSFSLYMNITEDKSPNGVPSLKVVKSSSMSVKNEVNTYLERNNLDDQIQTFDVIITHHLPKEEELKLYDIVLYERDNRYIIHRIVGIEEPDEDHPNCRHFLLQGDAVETPDKFPVLYSQMKGIYKGERIPFVGSFIMFMQSPAGWLCIICVIFAMVLTPILEKKLDKAIKARRSIIMRPELDIRIADITKESDAVSAGGKK